MKSLKKILYIVGCAVVITLSSCADFLKESSPDLIRPITVAHYKELLQGEAYFKEFYKRGWIYNVMSDNVTSAASSSTSSSQNTKAKRAYPAFAWADNVEAEENGFVDNFFSHMYKNILAANSCLLALDIMEGSATDRDVLEGQASFTRAYAYFVLANMYSQAYNEAQPNEPCVPLIKEATPSLKGYPRATISQIWSVITSDIDNAVSKLKNDTGLRSPYEISYDAALILASRIYLYMENFDKVIAIGEEYLAKNPELKDISGYPSLYYLSVGGGYTDATGESVSSSLVGSSLPAFLDIITNPEIKFTFSEITGQTHEGGYPYWQDNADGMVDIGLGVSLDLLNKYSSNDRRRNSWFTANATTGFLARLTYTCLKYDFYQNRAMYTQSMRTAEVYLNVAEAYARKSAPEKAQAVNLLNELRRNRITNYVNTSAGDFATDKLLVDEILLERRKELCFEEFHRWWDLRRTGQPSITHEWNLITGTERWVLNEKDPAYILNFPQAEREFNPELIENVRPERFKKN